MLGRCGIDIRGRSRKLRINYRTTEENRRWAVNLLEGLNIDDLDGALDNQKDYKSLLRGVAPEVRQFRTFPEEIEFIVQYLRRLEAGNGSLKETCLVTRTHELLKQYQNALNERGLETYLIHRSEAEDRKAPGVRLATMHRVKGLEFDRVVIAAVNEGVVPLETAVQGSTDPVVQRASEIRERALLYVAATRARKEVIITSFRKPSQFL